jgi:hypothetical protein
MVRGRDGREWTDDEIADAAIAAMQADEPPMPDVAPPPAPVYPAHTLPGPLGDLVAARGGLPAALVGGAGLGTLAAACPGARLHIAPTWVEAPALWLPLIAPRGAGKTPAMSLALQPLRDIEARWYDAYQRDLREWRNRPAHERGPRPVDPTRLRADLTLEMLARVLHASGGIATLAHDELSMTLRSLGEYKRAGAGSDRARILSLWSGQPWRYQRVTGDVDILIARPVVTIIGTIQPELCRLLGDERDGMRPRWLPHLAALDPQAHVDGGEATRPPSWPALIEHMMCRPTVATWTLNGHARTLWEQARARWKHAAQSTTETASTSAALTKADIQCARVALALAESLRPGAGGPIPADAMTAAVAIVDYAIGCWRALGEATGPGLSRREEVLDERVDRLRAWLDQHGGRATYRDLRRACVAGCRSASDLDAVLARYEATWPGTITVHERATGGLPTRIVHSPTAVAS